MDFMICRVCDEVYREGQGEDGIYCRKCQRKLERVKLSQLERPALEKLIKSHQDWINTLHSFDREDAKRDANVTKISHCFPPSVSETAFRRNASFGRKCAKK